MTDSVTPANPRGSALQFSIMLPVAKADRKLVHGDYHFGRSLARALERRGHRTRLLAVEEWAQASGDDVTLYIRGRASARHRIGRISLAWCISFFPKPGQTDYACIDHFFAASPVLRNRIARIAGKDRVSLMYQAFDRDLMYLDNGASAQDLVFVGTPRSEARRPVVPYAAASGLPFRLYGAGWESTPYSKFQAGGNVPNDHLGDIYRGASVIINDHLVVMRRLQIGSNRIYDALACGRPVLNDLDTGLPPDVQPFILPYADADSFRKQAEVALSESADRLAERRAFAESMRDVHSFDQRAEQILSKVDDLEK